MIGLRGLMKMDMPWTASSSWRVVKLLAGLPGAGLFPLSRDVSTDFPGYGHDRPRTGHVRGDNIDTILVCSQAYRPMGGGFK